MSPRGLNPVVVSPVFPELSDTEKLVLAAVFTYVSHKLCHEILIDVLFAGNNSEY